MRSLRTRLALAIAAISAILAAAIGLIVYDSSASDRLDRAHAAQADRVKTAASIFVSSGELALGAQIERGHVSFSRHDLEAHPPAWLQAAVHRGRLATYLTSPDGRPVLWAGMPLPSKEDRGIYVHRSFAADSQALGHLRSTLIVVGGLGTLGAALLGTAVAARLSRRLRNAAAVADRVARGDLDARIHASGRDEVSTLGNAVDDMAAALGERLERERRFSADVAHELRTPMTALTSAAEVLGDERPAQIVRERAGALRRLTEDLLELGQVEAGVDAAPVEPIDLEACARRIVAARAPSARIEVLSPGHAVADRRRLDRVLGNLLDNAVRHGDPPVVLRLDGSAIEVRDQGPGFPAELLDDGPQRFWTGARERGGGVGLGLTIAAAHARALGSELQLANDPGGGAVARVVLSTTETDV
jgi:signal transduction histidine kinase